MKRLSKHNIFPAILWAVIFLCHGAFATLTESQIFEWWDDQIITAEEANEMLSFLDEGNLEEACILAEALVNSSCEEDSTLPSEEKAKNRFRKNSKQTNNSRNLINLHGHILWKGRTDSVGILDQSRLEAALNFYKFRLKLGTQELLSYKDRNYEAHLGDISTRELHSNIPLDTFWGTAAQMPLGNAFLGGMLDSSKVLQGRLGYNFQKSASASLFLWHGHNNLSGGIQSNFKIGDFCIWQGIGQREPLIKINIHNKDTPRKPFPIQTFWKFTAYIHGDSVPEESHLSSTILTHKFWSSQNFKVAFPQWYNTQVATTTRIMVPLDVDTLATRIRINAATGPEVFRTKGEAICQEATLQCPIMSYKAGIGSSWEVLSFGGNFKVQHERLEQRWAKHQLELESGIHEGQNLGKAAIIFPKLPKLQEFRLRTEINLTGDFLDFTFATTFLHRQGQRLTPKHAYVGTKISF